MAITNPPSRREDRDLGSSFRCWKNIATNSALTPARPISVVTIRLLVRSCRFVITNSTAVIMISRLKTRM